MKNESRISTLRIELPRWYCLLPVIMALYFIAGNAPAAIAAGASGQFDALPNAQELSEDWGIELVSLRSTAAGRMIDFRYRVVDAEKAAPLFKRQTKPYLLHQQSGMALAVPNTAKIGALRNSNIPQQGRIYWMFFGNLHGMVQRGDLVTVAIGDFRVTDIEVQ